jgi:hypothetical protein
VVYYLLKNYMVEIVYDVHAVLVATHANAASTAAAREWFVAHLAP